MYFFFIKVAQIYKVYRKINEEKTESEIKLQFPGMVFKAKY